MTRLKMKTIRELNEHDLKDRVIQMRTELTKLVVENAKGTLRKESGKIKSLKREYKKFEISKAIIKEMNKISNENNSEFKFLILENFPKEQIDKYKAFLIKNNIALINLGSFLLYVLLLEIL